jgi:hypothetical protein
LEDRVLDPDPLEQSIHHGLVGRGFASYLDEEM